MNFLQYGFSVIFFHFLAVQCSKCQTIVSKMICSHNSKMPSGKYLQGLAIYFYPEKS